MDGLSCVEHSMSWCKKANTQQLSSLPVLLSSLSATSLNFYDSFSDSTSCNALNSVQLGVIMSPLSSSSSNYGHAYYCLLFCVTLVGVMTSFSTALNLSFLIVILFFFACINKCQAIICLCELVATIAEFFSNQPGFYMHH